jgi:hypothetical protein
MDVQAQFSNVVTSPKELNLTTTYHTNFWSYHAPIEIEYFDRKGIAFNPTALKSQKVTFLGDSISINFIEKNDLQSLAIIKLDSLDKNPSIQISNYGSAVLYSDTASFKYTIIGKKGGTQINLKIKEPQIIRLEEGETYQINIQLSPKKEAMKPGAYFPKLKKEPILRT